MSKQYVWIRLGDNAEYERYETVNKAALAVAEALPDTWTGKVKWRSAGVVLPPHYTGFNYVSVYKGGPHGEWYADLSDKEKAAFAGTVWLHWLAWTHSGLLA